MIKESAWWALIRLLWLIPKIPVIAHKQLWMFIRNKPQTHEFFMTQWVAEYGRFLLLINENNWQSASLLSAHMNTLIAWKQFTEVKIYNGSQGRKWRAKTDAIDVSCHGLDFAYLKAIIAESNYWINGITRHQGGLAGYQFLMRISQHWIDWVRIIKRKPTFNGFIMMIWRALLGEQRLIVIIIIIAVIGIFIGILHPPLLFRGCTWFGDGVSWAFTFRGTCPPLHHVLITIYAQDTFPCCIQD